MKIISLFNVALAVLVALAAAPSAFAQTAQGAVVSEMPDGGLDQDALVKVSFGAVMMQVPVHLALQLCPGTDPQELARASMVAEGIACVIPNESYASQPAADAGER